MTNPPQKQEAQNPPKSAEAVDEVSLASSLKASPSIGDRNGEFSFDKWGFDPETGVLLLEYGCSNGLSFVEKLDFGKSQNPDTVEQHALSRIASFLHIACGVSYYKATLSGRLRVREPLSQEALDFFRNFYFQGLAEFAYRNNVNLSDRINFVGPQRKPVAVRLALPQRSLVPIGGGKDSLTSIEILKAAKKDFCLFSVNPSRVAEDCARISEVPLVRVKRSLSENLFELNERGYPNGHVPITGIISLIACFAAIWHGFDEIVMSNERSANVGNVPAFGIDVNHQYSKSLDFESRLRTLLDTDAVNGMAYFSLLRPLSEIKIASLLARQTRYDRVFTSCNRVFRMRNPQTTTLWCGECAKCHFAFLCLATSFRKARLIGIFGKDLLDDRSNLQSYSELIGISGHKPWECVGETEEALAAMGLLAMSDEWRSDAVVRELAGAMEDRPEVLRQAIHEAFVPSERHFVPDGLMPYLQ